MSYERRQYSEAVTLTTQAACIVTGTDSTTHYLWDNVRGIAFQLNVTAAATAAADTLNVQVEGTIDGTNWFDLVSFTEIAGDGGAKKYITKIVPAIDEAMFDASAAVTAGAERHILPNKYRVAWAVVDDGVDNASFDFTVIATPL